MKIGIVILNYNDFESTKKLLLNLQKIKFKGNVVVVDNNSTDDSYKSLQILNHQKNFTLIQASKNGGYSYGNNIGLRYLVNQKHVDYAVILNPDVILYHDSLNRIEEVFTKNKKCGLTSPTMLNKAGKITRMWLKAPQYYNSLLDCFILGRQINKFIRKTTVKPDKKLLHVDVLAGSFLAFRAQTLKDINFLDENVFLFYEENILGEKLKRTGYETLLITDRFYVHNHSTTIRKNLSILNTFKCNLKSKLYFEKHYHNIGRIKEFLLINLMKYAVFEMSVILELKSIYRCINHLLKKIV